MAVTRNTKIGILLTFVIVVISTIFYFYQVFFESNFLVGKAESKWLYRPEKGNFASVKDSLEKNDIVHRMMPFAFVARLMGYQNSVKPGAYEISPDENNFSVIRRLRAGRQSPIKLTFNSFRTKRQLCENCGQTVGLVCSCASLPLPLSLRTGSRACQFGRALVCCSLLF
jgi:UPF0755 protein